MSSILSCRVKYPWCNFHILDFLGKVDFLGCLDNVDHRDDLDHHCVALFSRWLESILLNLRASLASYLRKFTRHLDSFWFRGN